MTEEDNRLHIDNHLNRIYISIRIIEEALTEVKVRLNAVDDMIDD